MKISPILLLTLLLACSEASDVQMRDEAQKRVRKQETAATPVKDADLEEMTPDEVASEDVSDEDSEDEKPANDVDSSMGQIPTGVYFLKSVQSKLCIDMHEGQKIVGMQVQVAECSGNVQQMFYLLSHSKGLYSIQSTTGLNLEIVKSSGYAGAPIVQSYPSSGIGQMFRLHRGKSGTFSIENALGGFYLEVIENKSSSNVHAWTPSEGRDQSWQIIPVEEETPEDIEPPI